MNNELAVGIIRRFIKLPLEKRRQYLQQMLAEGISPANLPIPELRSGFERLPLSFAQQRQWFLWQMEPHSAAYHIPTVLRLRGELDLAALEAAFAALIARHETLRTTFVLDGEAPIQRVHEPLPLSLEVSPRVDESALQATIAQEIARPFDLEQGPLLRVRLLQQAADEHVLVMTLHHIVTDGWSMPVMVEELVGLYQGYRQGKAPALPPLSIQYADYAIWQRRWMEAGEQARQLSYWTHKLGGEQPVLELPLDRPRPTVQDLAGARLAVELDDGLVAGLRALAQQQGVTLFMVLLASFQALLQRYSGQADIRVGVPAANRTRVETERLIGFFVNTQVLKAEFDGELTVSSLLAQVKRTALEAQAHQDLPFEQLVEALSPERNLSITPLFQAMFNHQAQGRGQAAAVSGLAVEHFGWEAPTAQFDLTLETFESSQGLAAAFQYATSLFDETTIARMARHWRNLLVAMVADAGQRVVELPMLALDEQTVLLEQWNSTVAEFPSEQCIQSLIEAQVARTPDGAALVFGEQSLTYAALNARANQLAHQLRALGVGPDVVVGIAAERSVEMVVGLLGILKAGGAYVPLDPEYPRDRLAYMIEDSGISLLLTQGHLREQLPVPGSVECLLLESAGQGYPQDNPATLTVPSNLAYVIYTSGSTGRPKGAGNSHRALVNRLHWMQKAYGLDASDTVLQKTPFSFDVSVWEFFWPLLTGARLAVAQPGAHRDPQLLVHTIQQFKVTTLHFVPSMLQAFMASAEADTCTGLRRIVCSGEALPHELAQSVLARLPQAGLYNLYGPTEAAIDVTHWTCTASDRSVPIGLPIDNLKTHILGQGLNPVPVGVNSELYLGGVGLARGYQGRPALTAERFVPDPFGHGERLYRTGDLARYRADGAIEYAGRLDHQVKIRGLRIELGEIDARTQEYPGVRESVVIDVDGPLGKQLIGYVVPVTPGDDLREGLKAHLKAGLPDYMVPAQWVLLEAMPLSPNGKLERKALPKPDMQSRVYSAPQTEAECQLAAVWADVLKIDQVGLDDNFFELGGDSIISIQLVARARNAGLALSPKQMFTHQTVRALAGVVGQASAVADSEQGLVTAEQALTPVQHWFFEQDIIQRSHWNQAVLLRPRSALQGETVARVAVALLNQHDALRLQFSRVGKDWKASYADPAASDLVWQRSVENFEALAALADQAHASLDIESGPLIRIVLAALPTGEQRLLIVVHHLVMDGISWRILLEDLQQAYEQASSGQPIRLPAKTTSFQRWAERLGEHARKGVLAREIDYWRDGLANASASLPCDNPGGSRTHAQVVIRSGSIGQAATQALLRKAPSAYRTQINDLLLTALSRVLCRWTGQASALIKLEGHGREDLFEDVDTSRTLGWFTSMYPVVLTPEATLAGSIKAVKEQLRAVPGKGIGYAMLRYMGDEATRAALAALPEPSVVFNYLGQFDQSFDVEKGLLVPASEGSGLSQATDTPLDGLISISGRVYGEALVTSWSFSQQVFEPQTIEALIEAFNEELTLIVTHCSQGHNAALTPSDVPSVKLDQARLDALPLAAREIESVLALSPLQQGMLFRHLYQQDHADYVHQMSVQVNGLDVARFRHAWQAALDRHDALRAVFLATDDVPLQVIRSRCELPFVMLDWRNREDREQAIAAFLEDDRHSPFDLACDVLLRLAVIRTGDDEYTIVYSNHHIILDGWSNARLFEEVLQHYHGLAVAQPRSRYADYIGWLVAQDAQACQAFWQQGQVALDEPVLLAAVGQAEPGQSGHRVREQVLDREWTQRLHAFAREQRVTGNTLVQACWALLLQRYTQQDTVVFGATVAGRPAQLPGIEQQLGLFINTLPVICAPAPEQSVGQWLQSVQDLNVRLREFEHAPLHDVQRWLGFQGTALFDTLLVFENYPISEALDRSAQGGLAFGELNAYEQTHYPLSLFVGLGEELSIRYDFDAEHLAPAFVDQVMVDMRGLIEQCIASSSIPVGALQLISARTEASMPVSDEWAQAAASPLLPRLFEAQAMSQPQAQALAYADGHMTYAELDRQANQLAHRLSLAGAGPETLVGVALERGPAMIVSLLAIMKAGAAYVPLDPEFPAERLNYMIEDSGLALLVIEPGHCEGLTVPAAVQCVSPVVGADDAEIVPPVEILPDHLAYVIYTSGSTGRPKGVEVTHGALVNFLQSMAHKPGLDAPDRVLGLTSLSFDIAGLELYLPWLVGACTVLLATGQNKDPHAIAQVIGQQQVSVVQATPSTWRMLLEAGESSSLQGLKLLCGGEALPQDLAASLRQAGGSLWNLYGPTETTIWSAVHAVTDDAPVQLGGPVANTSLYVLDGTAQQVACGCAGELFIGGLGLARGYHQRPALTAERFVPDPYSTHGGRLYRTGDLVRQISTLTLQYQSRLDHQVKIRGLRIELGEIESCLRQHDQVKEAVVIDRDGPAGKYLVGYVVPVAGAADLQDTLKAYLRASLPDYMVPAFFVLLESLPLTPNRKLDRKALPEPDTSATRAAQVEPRTSLQRQLAGIWAQVLDLPAVGLNDDFFDLGGHSLLATRVIGRIRRELGIEVALKALFESPDLAGFCHSVAQSCAETAPSIDPVDRHGLLPLSYAQQRQWFLWQLDTTSGAYNIPVTLRIHGLLDLDALQAAFNALIARHEPLRTTFVQPGGEPHQVLHADMPVQWAVEHGPVEDLHAWTGHEASRPFDLVQGPLMRVRLLQLAQDDHVLVLTLHHIVADGQSMPVLVDELVQFYQGAELPPLAIQYADYAAWQRQWMEAGEQERQLGYWTRQLGGEQPVLELPLDRPRPSMQDTRGAAWPVALDAGLSRSLKALARAQGVTLAQLLLASFQLLLARYSGQSDIRVGMPIANRTRLETERLIGFFVNTQVLKAEFDGELTVSGLLAQVKRTAIEAQAHQDLPFEQLVEALSPARNLGISPLFQALFNHQTEVRGDVRELPGLRVEGVEWGVESAKFDLSLDTFDGEHGIHASFTYATALFDEATIVRMASHWRNLLVAMIADVGQRVAQLPMLNDEERSGLIAQWNPTLADYPSQACLHQLIETQAARHPDATALVFEGQRLSYAELNRRANRIAHHLREQGVGPDVLVGLAVERSLEMVVGLVAVLKAGGAYLPLDPDAPADRLAYIIDDAGLTLLLTQQHLRDVLPVPANVQCLVLETAGEGYPEQNPVNLTTPASLAYVIYTSGSTGKPKGTLLPHHNVLRLFEATARDFAFDESDVWTLFHSYAFDFSVWEIFGALLYGGRLVIVPRAVTRSPEDFHRLLADEQVTVLNQTPSAFKQLMPVACASDKGLALRHVVFGGEALEIASLAPWFERFGDQAPRLINMYGITETTVHVTFRPVTLADLGSQAVSPIGRAIDDLSWYVLDGALNPVAPGCTGELHVGRAGLARGYLGRAALTAERFIPDPFAADGGRLYRTGDLANAGIDGAVEYIGRIDHQVKIRGFRIELGEIAAQLHQHPLVREAAVVDVDGPLGKQLVGYLVPKDSGVDPREALKAHLKAVLPDYMVPAHLVLLERLPLTTNGKLDRKALPTPEVEQQAYVAPVGETEQQVAAIWADVLKVEQVGRDDNFFNLGGHSLLATQVMARVRSELQIDAPLRALFEAGGLAEFAALVEQGHADTAPVLTPVDRTTSLELSYAQQRQWFLWQLEPDGTAYNIPSVLHLRGALDLTRLRGAFTRLIDRHEPLRTTFRQEGDRAVQVIHASLPFEMKVDTATDARLWVETEAKRPFDLLQGPLLRVRLLQLAEDDHVLVLTLHHIVADGQSMPVLVDELVQFYQGVELPPLAIQYADFAAWQRQWMEAGEKARQLSYWTQQLGGELPVLELPLDRPRPSMQDNRGAALPVALAADLSRSLKALARAQGVTLAQLLLASFQLLLARYSGQSDIRVGMPIANRTRLETERLIGFFVNTQVLKAEFDGELTVSGLLAQVKRTAIEAQAHQDLPFEQLVEALAPARNLGISPLFQAMFNHQTEVPSQTLQPTELSVTPFEWTVGSTHFDLSLDTFEGGTGLSASFTYATALFDPGTITRFAQHWCALLQAMVAAPEARVMELPLLSVHEVEQVLPTLDARDTIALEVKPVHLRIEEQAAARPDEVALICEGHPLTYSQLNRRANRLAHQLRHAGVGPEVLVGLCVERGLDMVVGLLAILKAGGAYVPLDPQYPRDRLGYMVEDSGIELLLTQHAMREQLQMPAQVRCLYLDDGSDAGFADANPTSLTSPDNLAYVMYTSGSTGRPKGVAIDHRSLATHTQVTVRFARLTPADRFLQFATLNFDGFVEQLYPALSIGASVVIRGPEIWDSETFYRQLIEQRITHCDLTTAYWFMLVQDFAAVGARPYGQLRQVHIGGEAMPPEGIEAWRQAGLGDVALINTYGPTEATVVVTTFDCGPLVHANAALPTAVPIGQTLPGRVIRVLDDQGQTALPGARGELLIGGQLLARGYFQRPSLTAERFIPDPFSADGGRLYRSGDLATYTTDGRLDYAGRLDHQVKIRGLRIELGEIEAHILADVSVREAVVLAVEGALGKQLVAYVVPSAPGDDPRLALRSTLRANLPDYMVPGAWILMAALPLSPNGKLDRRALPAPDFAQSHIAYVEPRTALEVDLARIWSQVLEAERVGLEDNFFELGGHSLLATRVVSTLRTEQGLDVPLRLLFEHPTLGEFAQAIETQATSLSDDGLAEIEQLMNEWAEI